MNKNDGGNVASVKMQLWGSGCGSVGIAIAFDPRGP